MKRSPLLYSCTFIASLSLLNTASAWSAPESQDKPKATVDAKAKTIKAKTHKAKTSKTNTAKKAVPIRLASADSYKFVPVATNPYLASQPVAILPKAVNPYSATSGITVPTPSAPVISAPIISAPAAPVFVAPIVAATTPSAAQSVAAASAVATPASAPMAVNQAWNSAPIGKNPYLTNQAFTPSDPAKLFSQFGNDLKISWPSFSQSANSAPPINNTGNPVTTANSTQTAVADAANSFNQIFTSLKMALPSFPQSVVNPSKTDIANTSNSFNQILTSLKSVLPSGPLSGDTTYLPVIKTVYPTGEKPLVVLNFKCPTEMLGITPPPMKLLHEIVNLGFDGLNKTNLLSFNLQQVCS